MMIMDAIIICVDKNAKCKTNIGKNLKISKK
jgi:hypothetical protein